MPWQIIPTNDYTKLIPALAEHISTRTLARPAVIVVPNKVIRFVDNCGAAINSSNSPKSLSYYTKNAPSDVFNFIDNDSYVVESLGIRRFGCF